jgi:hypothetical protein
MGRLNPRMTRGYHRGTGRAATPPSGQPTMAPRRRLRRGDLRLLLMGQPDLTAVRRRDAWKAARAGAEGVKASVRRRSGDRTAAGGFLTWLPLRLIAAMIAARMVVYPTIVGPGMATLSVHRPGRDPRIAFYGALALVFGLLFAVLVAVAAESLFDPLTASSLVVIGIYLVGFGRCLVDAVRDWPLAVERRRIVAAHPGLVLAADGLISARPWDGYRISRLLVTVADDKRIAIIAVAVGEPRITLYRRTGFTEKAQRRIGRERKCLLLRLPSPRVAP